MTIIIIHVIINTVVKNLIGTNGRTMAALIGQQHHLVRKRPMADRYIVLCFKNGSVQYYKE